MNLDDFPFDKLAEIDTEEDRVWFIVDNVNSSDDQDRIKSICNDLGIFDNEVISIRYDNYRYHLSDPPLKNGSITIKKHRDGIFYKQKMVLPPSGVGVGDYETLSIKKPFYHRVLDWLQPIILGALLIYIITHLLFNHNIIFKTIAIVFVISVIFLHLYILVRSRYYCKHSEYNRMSFDAILLVTWVALIMQLCQS